MASTTAASLPLAALSLSPPPSIPPPTPTPRRRSDIRYTAYTGEHEVPRIMDLVDTELSEPYNFYTYRYFLQDWCVTLLTPLASY
jgi:peptide alpha-N-acetyltransferase